MGEMRERMPMPGRNAVPKSTGFDGIEIFKAFLLSAFHEPCAYCTAKALHDDSTRKCASSTP